MEIFSEEFKKHMDEFLDAVEKDAKLLMNLNLS